MYLLGIPMKNKRGKQVEMMSKYGKALLDLARRWLIFQDTIVYTWEKAQ
jgi:hypothetical protein